MHARVTFEHQATDPSPAVRMTAIIGLQDGMRGKTMDTHGCLITSSSGLRYRQDRYPLLSLRALRSALRPLARQVRDKTLDLGIFAVEPDASGVCFATQVSQQWLSHA